MNKLTLVVVLVGILSVVFALDQPPATSTVYQPVNITLALSAVIGQNTTSTYGYYNDIGPNSIYHPQGLAWFKQSNYSSKLGGPGLLATDSEYYRALFFQANNLQQPTSYNLVFGASNSTNYGSTYYYSIDYSSNGVYALVGYSYPSIYFWNYSSINLAAGNAFPNPDAIFGNNSVETGLNQYAALYYAESMVTKKSTGEIFVADYDNARIVVYPPTVSSNNQQPSYVIGQNDSTLTSYYDCSSTSPTTCIYRPKWIAFDCYDGLWVWDSYYATANWFSNGSRISTFKFNTSSDMYVSSTYGLVSGPTCNTLTLLASSAVYVFQITYVNQIPVAAQSLFTFGSRYNYGNTDYSNTGSFGYIYGAAFDTTTGTAYFSDNDNYRIAAVNMSALVSAGNSVNPSSGASAIASSSNNPRSTSTASAAALSSGASSYPSSTNTAVYSSEVTSESNSPIYPFSSFGASSQLSSWVALFDF